MASFREEEEKKNTTKTYCVVAVSRMYAFIIEHWAAENAQKNYENTVVW